MHTKHESFFSLFNWLLLFSTLTGQDLYSKPLDINVHAESAILINGKTGAVLYEKKADSPKYPASIIKIVTTIYALEKKIPYSKKIHVSREAVRKISPIEKQKDFSKYPSYLLETDVVAYGAKAGEKISGEDLLSGIMLHSAGDLCNVVAEEISGSIPKFIDECNQFLHKRGFKRTHMTNPHGLHHPDQITTAREMAYITKYALQNPKFRELAGTKLYKMHPTNLTKEPPAVINSNRLLRKGSYHYAPAIGVKTGYHSAARHTFVAAAENEEGRLLIAVLLKNDVRNNMFIDAKRLFELAYAEKLQTKTPLAEGPLDFSLQISGSDKPLPIAALHELTHRYYPAEDPEATLEFEWMKLRTPILQGQKVGEAKLISKNGEMIVTTPIYSLEAREGSWILQLRRFLTRDFTQTALGILAIVALIGSYAMYRWEQQGE